MAKPNYSYEKRQRELEKKKKKEEKAIKKSSSDKPDAGGSADQQGADAPAAPEGDAPAA
jgi:hypothetical protein